MFIQVTKVKLKFVYPLFDIFVWKTQLHIYVQHIPKVERPKNVQSRGLRGKLSAYFCTDIYMLAKSAGLDSKENSLLYSLPRADFADFAVVYKLRKYINAIVHALLKSQLILLRALVPGIS